MANTQSANTESIMGDAIAYIAARFDAGQATAERDVVSAMQAAHSELPEADVKSAARRAFAAVCDAIRADEHARPAERFAELMEELRRRKTRRAPHAPRPAAD